MTNMSTSIKEIIDRLWEEGRRSGLSDSEITAMIEKAIQEKQKPQTQQRNFRKKYSYIPMTDEEIKAAQTKIDESPVVEAVVVKMPQLLYGPPPTEEVREFVEEIPQVLYGPPPKPEVYEMFADDPKTEDANTTNHTK